MKIQSIEITKGSPLYLGQAQIKEYWGIGKTTFYTRIREFKKEVEAGRYPRTSIIEDGHFTWIHAYAWADFLANRRKLLQKNTRKTVKPYDVKEWEDAQLFKAM